MLRGLPASIVLHAAVIGFGSFALPYTRNSLSPEQVPIPIELIIPSIETNISVASEDLDEPAAPPETFEEPDFRGFLQDIDTIPELETEDLVDEEIVDDEPSFEPSDDASPESLPETVPTIPEPVVEEAPVEEVTEPVEDTIPEDTVPEDEPETEPVAPPPPPSKKQEVAPVDPLKDLLSRSRRSIDDERQRSKSQSTSTNPQTPQSVLKDEEDIPTRSAGQRERLEAEFQEFVKGKMLTCWRDTVDKPNPERLLVRLLVKFNVDGTLDGDLEILRPKRIAIGDTYMRNAVEEAQRATRNCAPYRLPKEDYDLWRQMTFTIGK